MACLLVHLPLCLPAGNMDVLLARGGVLACVLVLKGSLVGVPLGVLVHTLDVIGKSADVVCFFDCLRACLEGFSCWCTLWYVTSYA